MLTETQLKRYADVLIWGLRTARSKPFKKGDIVLVRFNIDAIRLAEILEARLLEMGMNPIRRMSPTPEMEKIFSVWPTDGSLSLIHRVGRICTDI
jgi:aminopeptidase